MTVTAGLTLREDPVLAGRLARSAATRRTSPPATVEIPRWLAGVRRRYDLSVRRVPFSALDGWSFTPDTGNLVHHTGRFFAVEGLHVRSDAEGAAEWQQPVIVQPEVGILGILAKEFDGVLHLLMQAKMEPGNPNLVQLSPTVQATHSNFTGVHRGARVPYLEHFTTPTEGHVLTDVLQSEHGSWFWRKVNRNLVVEVAGEVPVRDGYRWLTLGELGQLLHLDNVVNMDARSVLACLPLWDGHDRAHTSDTAVRSWFTGERTRRTRHAERIPLAQVRGWRREPDAITHAQGRYFRVVAIRAEGGGREVAGWSQPLLAPVAQGVVAFLVRRFGGVPHVLVHARVEPGFVHTVELGPTVQYTPANYAHLAGAHRPPFLDAVLAADPSRVRYAAVHAEEGGRFLEAENRYLLVEADEGTAPAHPPPGFQWVTPAQLSALVRHSHYVNVQARTLLAVLGTQSAVP